MKPIIFGVAVFIYDALDFVLSWDHRASIFWTLEIIVFSLLGDKRLIISLKTEFAKCVATL